MKVMEVKATEWLERARPLFEESWRENMAPKGMPPPDVDMRVFQALEDASMLVALVALTNSDEIVGYTISIIVPMFMYGNHVVMNNESIFVRKDYRGTVPLKLIRATVQAAKARGASKMLWHSMPGTKAEELWPRLGYETFDTVWTKEI